MPGLGSILSACTVLVAGVAAHADPVYKALAIPLLPGATFGEAVSVNNKGVAIGRCLIGGVYHGFMFDAASDTTPIDLGPLGPSETHGLWGINDEGWIVGTMQVENDPFDHALLIAPGGARIDITRDTTVRTPMGSAQARAINSLGSIAGISTFDCSLSESTGFGSRWSPGGFFVTPLLGSNFECAPSSAFAINDAGILAGSALMNVGSPVDPLLVERPFICDDDSQIPLPTFSSPLESGIALAISSQSDVCGSAQDLSDSGRTHPALWLGTEIIKLNSIGGFLEGSCAFGVNGNTDIVGRSGDEPTGQAVIWYSGDVAPVPLTDLLQPAPRAPGFRLTAALAVSDGGFIVGRGTGISPADESGQTVPFLLLPCEPVIIQPPLAQTSCLRGSPAFSVRAVGAGPLNYQWRRNGIPLDEGPQPSGAVVAGSRSRLMRIFGFSFDDAGNFDVVITGSCGTTITPVANTHVCRPDLSCDGIVSDSDFPIFVDAYNILDCADPVMPPSCPADFNEDGFVDDADFVLFVQAYEVLFCP
ncbi:MAG: hypothetical protein J0L78_03850 [Planctomycetes bacterium]|nr:hypothetical protein [Planctomycetota bacterium]